MPRDRPWPSSVIRSCLTWRNAFLALNRAASVYERLPWKPGRRLALRLAEQWLLEHLERSDGLAAIYPAMMNAVLALVALGRPAERSVDGSPD